MSRIRTAAYRRAWLAIALLAGAAFAGPGFAAQTCNGSPKAKIDPLAQTVAETTGGLPTQVTLNGSTSTPANGNLTYQWQYTGSTPTGLAVTLLSATSDIATFAAPSVAFGGATLHFKLTVCGVASTAATTDIVVTDVVTNAPPTAVATVSPATSSEGTLVTLDGSASFDPDPGTTLSYSWTQIGGSPTVSLTNVTPTGSKVTFVAPNTPVTTGASLTFRLTVSDGTLSGSTDKIANIVWTNDPPVAALVCPGGLLTVDEGDPVTLDGSGSSDSDGAIAGYAWDQVAGLPNLGIGALTTPSISFNAPQLGYNQLGGITLRLTVSDNTGASSSTECGVFINDVTPPVLDVPADSTIEAQNASGTAHSYTATAMDAVDDETPRPLACTPVSGSVFALGTTTVHCSTSDSAGNSASASFKVTVADNTAPVLGSHGDVAVEATSAAGALATFDLPTVSDAVDTTLLATCVPASGSQFPLGDTKVQCDASDGSGNAAEPITFHVNVLDTTAPAVTPPADVVAEATGPLTAVAHGTATAIDAVGVTSLTSDAPASFPVAVTTIHWTATDAAGNAGHAESLVTVQDTTAPTIDAHDAIENVEASSGAGAAVHYLPPATHDAVDGDHTATCLPASDSTFALGTTTVTCNASDAHDNAATPTTFDITVVDTTAPDIDVHATVTKEATGSNGASVTYTSPATHDLVDGAGTATCTPASGTTFALGTHAVDCTATDAHHNSAHSSFNVTVTDTTPPTIAPHDPVAGIEATGPAGAEVAFDTPLTHDLVDGDGIATCVPATGATFPLGTTTVLCDAQDAHHNAAIQTSFTVQVVDTTAPVIAVHGDVGPIEATSGAGAIATYVAPTWTDAVDVSGSASCSPLSGTQFALGQTIVACAAHDHAGNAATITYFKVTVRDSTAPVIAAHGNLTAEATSAAGAVVAYASPATSDAVDGAGVASCLPASGSTFALGTSTVTCNAHDAAGNASQASTFSISVVDTTAPAIAPHADVNATATGNSSALVAYTLPIATDLVDGNVAVTCLPASGTSFNVGSTTVSCGSTDHAGNHSASSFNVIVSYGFSGFFRPVDNLPTVNVVKAGSAIPVKFSLGGDQGLNIFASGYPASISTGCSAATTDAIEETVTAGGSSLSYDAAGGQYIYVWKTEKSWSGCRQLQVKLRDGSSRWAIFSFTR
jgi:hypothetical protein